jgi:hypothetical protein
MTRWVLICLLIIQSLHIVAVLPWLRIVDFVRNLDSTNASAAFSPAAGLVALSLYMLIIVGLSVASWISYWRRNRELAFVFVSIPLFFTLPLLAYGLVTFLAHR